MSRGIIRFVTYAVTMCILMGVLEYLNNRDNVSHGKGETDSNYVVRAPGALKYSALALAVLGIIMFFIFIFFYLKNNPTITRGHLRMALIVTTVGFLIVLWAVKWRISVVDSKMEIHRIFHSSQTIDFSEISKVEIGKKEEIILYGTDDNKLITIDGLSDNYDRFMKSLKLYGKVK